MSNTPKQSPLGANSTSSLLQNTGLNINPVAAGYMGESKVNSAYTLGTTVSTTCLYNLTRAINLAYPLIGGTLTSTTYNNLISIGSTTIPALGNSKPPTYTTTDPSGQWTGEANTGYGISGTTGNGQGATWIPYDTSNSDDSITQWGFVRLFALQAWNEFNYNGIPAGSGMPLYTDFLSSFTTASSFVQTNNTMINSFYYGSNFLDGIYSNMDDLISADITNVSLSTTLFGQDCITLGKVIDLTQIQKFGLPSVLLQTLKRYNAITQSLSLALLASGLTTSEIELISIKNNAVSQLQEEQIYGAFLIIVGQDLRDILIPLNCKTQGIESLTDLLNIQKIFPNSYQTLTVPIYNADSSTNNSKTFYPMYDGTGINSRLNTPAIKEIVGTIIPPGKPSIASETFNNNIQLLPKGFDSYLVGILPTEVALAAGAFSYSMQQIRNIQFVEFEKFAQVVYNIETTFNLNLINGTTVPANTTLMNQGLTLLGLGSGPNKTYTMSDFFGSMSGLPYNWKKLTELILNTQTAALVTIYQNIYNAIIAGAPGLNATVQGLINNANAEILSIYNTNSSNVQQLNALYEQFGSQLTIEQRARYIGLAAVPIPRDTKLNPYPMLTINFVDSVMSYAQNTLPHMEAQTIEAISNLNIVGGQSIVGLMRELRNQARLQKIGINQDNTIPGTLDPESEKELLCNGTLTYNVNGSPVTTIPSTEIQEIDAVEYQPQPVGSLQNVPEYQAPVYVIDGKVLDVGEADYPGSLAGSNYVNLVPINLNTTYSSGTRLPSSLSIQEAIDQVIHCNCNCWLG
jgi:hypothetical protein